jgi:hypothetical protein
LAPPDGGGRIDDPGVTLRVLRSGGLGRDPRFCSRFRYADAPDYR